MQRARPRTPTDKAIVEATFSSINTLCRQHVRLHRLEHHAARQQRNRRVPWTHLPMVSAPFADFTWRHARRLAAQAGLDDANETEVARVLDDLLARAQADLVDKISERINSRTRVAAPAHRRPPREDAASEDVPDAAAESGGDAGNGPLATVIPFGIFDADAEAERRS